MGSQRSSHITHYISCFDKNRRPKVVRGRSLLWIIVPVGISPATAGLAAKALNWETELQLQSEYKPSYDHPQWHTSSTNLSCIFHLQHHHLKTKCSKVMEDISSSTISPNPQRRLYVLVLEQKLYLAIGCASKKLKCRSSDALCIVTHSFRVLPYWTGDTEVKVHLGFISIYKSTIAQIPEMQVYKPQS